MSYSTKAELPAPTTGSPTPSIRAVIKAVHQWRGCPGRTAGSRWSIAFPDALDAKVGGGHPGRLPPPTTSRIWTDAIRRPHRPTERQL